MEPHLTFELDFVARAEPYRREIQAHCYRMMGSLQDAEDLAQETFLRAWQKRATLREESLLRAWLYKIATNACLDALERRPKRVLPVQFTNAANPNTPPAPPLLEPIWLEPFPDAWLADASTNPEARVSQRESISLAFLAALQTLPPRQRAIILLRDVLEWSAAESAQLLNLTLSSVNSALHRARVTLAKQYSRVNLDTLSTHADEPRVRELLRRYIHAWEAANVDEMLSLLREDATLLMPPSPSWVQGKRAIGVFAKNFIWGPDARGKWKLRATRANGEWAFAWYRREEMTNVYRAFALQTLELKGGKLARGIVFVTPALFRFFDLAETYAVSERS